MREVTLPAVIGTRVEAETAADLRRLAALSGRTVAEELRLLIRQRVLKAHFQGDLPGQRALEN